MKRHNWGLYAIALAVLFIGLIWVGVPTGTLFIAALVLVCPVMMFFMMHGMHNSHEPSHTDHQDQHTRQSTLDRR